MRGWKALLLSALMLGAGPTFAQAPAPPPRLFGTDNTPPPSAQGSSARPARLDYRGPETCPPEPIFRNIVGARTRFEPFDPQAPDSLSVVLDRQAGAYRASAELHDASGARRWIIALGPAGDCRALVEALGSFVAAKLDPFVASAPAPAPPVRDDWQPPPAVAPAPAPAVSDKPSPKPRTVRLGAAAVAVVGGAPSVAMGVRVDVGVRWSFLSLAAEGHADLPAGADAAGGARVTVYRLSGALVPCGHWRWLFGCGVIELGMLRASSIGVDHPAGASLLHVAAGARVGAEIGIVDHLAARASADLLGTLQRSTLTIDGHAAWSTPPVSGAFGAGLVVLF